MTELTNQNNKKQTPSGKFTGKFLTDFLLITNSAVSYSALLFNSYLTLLFKSYLITQFNFTYHQNSQGLRNLYMIILSYFEFSENAYSINIFSYILDNVGSVCTIPPSILVRFLLSLFCVEGVTDSYLYSLNSLDSINFFSDICNSSSHIRNTGSQFDRVLNMLLLN